MTENIYTQNGHANRQAYLKSLADNLGIDQDIVDAAADLLGESEDFDGLVTTLEDYSDCDQNSFGGFGSAFTQEFDDFSDADGGL